MEVRGCGGASRQRAGGRGGGLEATRHRVSGTCLLRFAQYGGGSRAYGVYGVGACWLLVVVHTSVAHKSLSVRQRSLGVLHNLPYPYRWSAGGTVP